MSTGIWQPGALYIPGSLVRPRTAPAVVQSAPTNADFEAGASGWTLPTGYTIGEHGHAFLGTWSLEAGPTAASGFANNNMVPVTPGMRIVATAMVNHGDSGSGDAGGAVIILWYDAAMVELGSSDGNQIRKGSTDVWYQSSVVGTAPAGAAYAAIGGFMYTTSDPIWMDQFAWDYTYATAPPGLIYKAVQALSGYSDSTEPVWPVVLGNTVVDNEVTWEAVLSSRVVYEAHPILKSGAMEPDFPDEIGGTVMDNVIIWEAVSRQITDSRCPHSKVVVTGASKIFAADQDIIPYSATNNPLDWSTKDDAGFLPFGLQRFGGEPVLAMGLYRSNLVAANGAGSQMWQIDEDPQNMALLDAVPVGCRFHQSMQPVANDLAFLTDVGIRNFGIAAASTNLQAGDFAKPIDPLVKAAVRAGTTPIGLFYPGTGQYMLFFGADAYVLTFNGTSSNRAARSRYQLAGAVDDWTILDGVLYLRSGEQVWRFDDNATRDDALFLQPTVRLVGGDSVLTGQPPDMYGYIGYIFTDQLQTVGSLHSANYTSAPYADEVVALYSDNDGSDDRLILVLGGGNPDDLVPSQDFFTTLAVGHDGNFGNIYDPDIGTEVITVASDDADFYTGEEFFGFPEQAGLLGQGSEFVFNNLRVWVWYIESNILEDYVDETLFAQMRGGLSDTVHTEGDDFEGYIAWHYLELQGLGDETMLHGFDLVGTGSVDVSFGYDQKREEYATDPYTIQADTLTGQPIAMPIKAPSVQLRLTFAANQRWTWSAARLYDDPVNT